MTEPSQNAVSRVANQGTLVQTLSQDSCAVGGKTWGSLLNAMVGDLISIIWHLYSQLCFGEGMLSILEIREVLWTPIVWAWNCSIHLEKVNEMFVFCLVIFLLKNKKRECKNVSDYMKMNIFSILESLIVFSTGASMERLRLAHPEPCRIRDLYVSWTSGNTDSSSNREMQERELCQRQWDSMWKALSFPPLHGN